MLTKKRVYEILRTILDPELHIDLVSLGLIYDVSISPRQTERGTRSDVHILMTLTTPGCPLAAVFDQMIRKAFEGIEKEGIGGFDPLQDLTIELTFDPPWIIDMMDPEARAQLGL